MGWALVLVALLTSDGALASSNTETVERFVDAFSDHDVDAMLERTTDDVHWMSVSDDRLSIEASGREDLREAMTAYFSSTPSARAEIVSSTASGSFVHTTEKAIWAVDGTERSRCSMVVYELAGSRIRNVWYFPAQECS